MEIILEETGHNALRWVCWTCGEGFELDEVNALLVLEHETVEFARECGRYVCPTCVEAGPGGLAARMREHAKDLYSRAEGLEHTAKEEIVMPTKRDLDLRLLAARDQTETAFEEHWPAPEAGPRDTYGLFGDVEDNDDD